MSSEKNFNILAELRNKAITAVKEYNEAAKSQQLSSRLNLADCSTYNINGVNIDYIESFDWVENLNLSTTQSSGLEWNSSEDWYDSGCSF